VSVIESAKRISYIARCLCFCTFVLMSLVSVHSPVNTVGGIMFSTCLFVRPSVRSFVTNILWTQCFETERTKFAVNWH